MDEKLINEIMDVALKVDHNKYKAKTTSSEKEKKKAENYVKRWSAKLRDKRRGATTFIKASSLSNILFLGFDYISNQYKGSKSNLEKFKLSILGIRPKRVANMFFSTFTKQHIYTDSYRYDRVNLLDATGEYVRNSRDLKYCNPDLPIYAGYDPGRFTSIVFGQPRKGAGRKEFRIFKNMYVIEPKQHHELAAEINEFFRDHKRKFIKLHYDRAANQRKPKYKDNKTGKTDAKILQAELVKLGWKVELLDLGRETIFHSLHYALLNILFGEKDSRTPRLSICQYECEELISSIYYSPVINKGGIIQLDKSSEDKLPLDEQAMYSTQIGTALMYLLYGMFETFLPNKSKASYAYGGL